MIDMFHLQMCKSGSLIHIKEEPYKQFVISININTIKDSIHVNSCLYKKISVDAKGNIKNCPSSSKILGNIKNESKLQAVDNPSLKELWLINKSLINVCKDCEFRLICIDCRVNIQNPADIYSKPKSCNYDPYQAEYTV